MQNGLIAKKKKGITKIANDNNLILETSMLSFILGTIGTYLKLK